MPTLAAFHSVSEHLSLWVFVAGEVLGVLMVPVVLASKRVPQAKTAWILALVGFPWLGTFFYFTIGRRTLHRKVARLRGKRAALFATSDRARRESGVFPPRRGTPGAASEMVLGAEHVGALPPIPGNEFTLLAEGPDAFAAGSDAIRTARHHVHLVTYIFKNDPTGRSTLRLLEQAARRGVEVRVLYDGLGTIWTGAEFFEPIVRAGGEVSSFLPFSPFVSGLRLTLRNHRKLMVVDGHTAFTGGMNIGDEYATGHNWRDVHVRLRGPVVPALQRVFAEDWYFATGRLVDADPYYAVVPRAGDVPVQVVDSGPDQDPPQAEELMFGALASARRSVDIVTPYLVPTEPLEQALRSAARRGRRVRVLLPEFVDHRVVRWATDSYLPSLLDAGVEIWRHPHMTHGKVVIVDGAWVTLGSTNLDMRSLRLNFELNVAIPHVDTAAVLTRYFEGELRASRRLTEEDLRAGFALRMLRQAAHLLSPML